MTVQFAATSVLDVFGRFLERTSQFTLNDWLLTFACIILASYALLLSRR